MSSLSSDFEVPLTLAESQGIGSMALYGDYAVSDDYEYASLAREVDKLYYLSSNGSRIPGAPVPDLGDPLEAICGVELPSLGEYMGVRTLTPSVLKAKLVNNGLGDYVDKIPELASEKVETIQQWANDHIVVEYDQRQKRYKVKGLPPHWQSFESTYLGLPPKCVKQQMINANVGLGHDTASLAPYITSPAKRALYAHYDVIEWRARLDAWIEIEIQRQRVTRGVFFPLRKSTFEMCAGCLNQTNAHFSTGIRGDLACKLRQVKQP